MNGFRATGMALFCCAGLSIALPAEAQTLNATNAQAIAAYLRSEGASTTVKTDKDGDPLIESSLGKDKNFSVYFYNCTNHQNCQSLQFYAGYAKTNMDAAKLNDWNRGQRFGRAYIDLAGDPVVEMDIDMAGAGMSRALFQDNFEFWKTLMNKFSEFVYK